MHARLLVSLALLAAVGCAGSAPEAEPCADPVPADAVRLEDFVFEPDCLSAAPGDRVRLDNVGEAPHTFTVEGTDVDVDVPAGETGEAGLAGVEPGTYAITCTYHPQMTATLAVDGQ
jgi:plastocyanin